MKKHFRRLSVLFLTLCLTLTMVPGVAMAANVKVSTEVKNLLVETADASGFALEYNGDVQLVEAKGEGLAVTATIPYTAGVRERTVTVLVQAVDAKGQPLENHPVHFILGERVGSQIRVTYQEHGCRYFAMMPAQYALEQGTIVPLSIEIKPYGNGYAVYYEAHLVISDIFAKICALNKNDVDTLRNLRFTCYLEDALLEMAGPAGEDDYHFENPTGIFESVDVVNTGHGFGLIYKLSEDEIVQWPHLTTAEVAEHLQTPMHMTCDRIIPASVMKDVVNSEGEIYTYGRVEITYVDGDALVDLPGVDITKIIVPALMAKVNVTLGSTDMTIVNPTVTGVDQWLNTDDHTAFMQGDEKGNFRPDDSITRAEVATIFYRLLKNKNVTETAAFVDVAENAWYAEAVNTLASLGIVNGVGDGKFEPNRSISRAEFAAIATRFAEETTGGITFADVSSRHWAYEAIATAASYGWVNGVGGGRFEPDRSISRAEAATMVNRMLGRLSDKAAIDAGRATEFPDVTAEHWGWYNIGEATTDHSHTVSSDRASEIWN